MGTYKKNTFQCGGYELEEKFKRVCSGFKFDKDFLNKRYNNLSGGEKTIVNLARILLKNPDILLLDEPTNHLDVETLDWLEKFLIDYKGTILLVSHDRYFLDKVATKTILLENGKAKIYFGNYSYFLKEMEVHYGEKVHLKGKNGSGKSTLVKIILGEDNDYSGEVRLGSSVKIGYIPQEIKFANEESTILEYFLSDYTDNETKARTFLAKYSFFGENVFKRLRELSGGERVRLILAKLVLQETNFLILDEPTNHLDISTREILEDTLEEYNGTILFVSHDRYFARKLAKREFTI